MRFVGKVAIITGASSGIGKCIATNFASEGCKVAITGRDEVNLLATKNNCIEKGLSESDILTIIGDVKDVEFLKRLVDETVKKFNRIDILINNAGMFIFDDGIEQFDTFMHSNTRSAFALITLTVPYLQVTKGNVVNISSVGSLRPGSHSLYGMSKAAMDYLTKSEAVKLAKLGIRVNCVNPGGVHTNIHREIKLSEEEMEKQTKKWIGLHLLGRFGSADEIAKPTLFLASDEASFITGACLPVDGGISVCLFPDIPN